MKLHDVGLIIASREFQTASGKVVVLIGKPERFPDGEDYYCPYQIVGLTSGSIMRAAGVDTAQALICALKMIGADLFAYGSANADNLSWIGGKGAANSGFPMPD